MYREHVAGVWRYVRTRVPGAADADDVTAEVFVKAMRSWYRFDDRRGSVGAWLIGIARHVVADWWVRRSREVPVAEGESILDAALRAGMDLPFACKGGMCSTCRAKLVEGEARMEVNYSLEPWELKAGFILTCQARPVSEKVMVDYDHV